MRPIRKTEIDPLTRIAMRCDTDKWGGHFYTPIYHKLLKHMRRRAVKVLEIGVGGYEDPFDGGGSLEMWAQYFPKGAITGLDISAKRALTNERIHILQGSQSNPDFLAGISHMYGPFDVIIDDGSHQCADILTSFESLFAGMVDGGIYIIEDTQAGYWKEAFGGSLDFNDPNTMMGIFKSVVDQVNHAEIARLDPSKRPGGVSRTASSITFYHNIIAIEKGDNSDESNFVKAPTARRLKALDEIDDQLIDEPDNAQLRVTRARVLEHLGQMDAACAELKRAAGLEPKRSFYRAKLAHFFAGLGEWEAAAREFRKAANLSPGNPYFESAAAKADAMK